MASRLVNRHRFAVALSSLKRASALVNCLDPTALGNDRLHSARRRFQGL